MPFKLKNHARLALAICLALSWISLSFATENTVVQINIEGNHKTLASTILQELPYSVGDSIDKATLDKTAQAVKDLGLFETVNVSSTVQSNGNIIPLIKVKEKRYNFVLPKLNRNGDGDITTGIVWRSDNLFGRNQQSKLTYSYRKYEDTDEEDETQIRWEYSYPRIHNTPYSLAFTAAREETLLEETTKGQTGEYDRSRKFAKLLIGRWFNKKGPTHGLNIKIGPLYDKYEHNYISGTPGLLPNLTIQGLSLRIDKLSMHDNLLSRSGHHYGYEILLSDDAIGSDKNFLKHFFFYRKYVPLQGMAHHNLNWQFRIGMITESILGPLEYKIGGSRALRGYDRDKVEGNAFTIFNIEYLRPIFNRETLRSAVFMDIGNAWPNPKDASFSDLKYAAGVGLRWKLKRFVRTDVRLDIAHGFSNNGSTKAYLSTRATF